jgi:ribonuclease T2
MRGNARPSRRRRRGGIAALVGGAIAAVLLNWLGFGANTGPASAPKPSAETPPHEALVAPTGTAVHQPAQAGSYYTLALSLAPAFCGSQTRADRAPKKQCAQLSPSLDAATPLTLHGLWPESARGRSMSENCAAQNVSVKQLEQTFGAQRLYRLMPGVVDGLAGHEWRKHGACSGLDSTQYFGAALDWTERINAALSGILHAASGKELSASGMRNGANTVMPGLAQAVTFHCRNLKNGGGKPVLMELRVCLSQGANGAPAGLTECAALDRIDQGCGARFQVARP